MNAVIRPGKKTDLPRLRELIIELAVFEKEPNAVTNTIEMMEQDGFGDNPIYGFIVAEKDEVVVGAAIYYYRYSTWKGKRLYLEDLIVTEEMRGIGIGKELFESTINIGKRSGCTGMMWQVLDWNKPAIDFYNKYNAKFEEDWTNCSLSF